VTTNQPTPPSNYASLTTAQQNAFWISTFQAYPGTVTAAWVASNSSLKPYQGLTAVGLYEKLGTQFPTASPQQKGSTVYQVWLGAGTAGAIGDIIGATGTAVGAVATGVSTASILPSWTNGLTSLLGDLTSASLWIRIAKVIIGGAMLLVGIAKLTGASGVAAKAVKVAPLL
jgi:hypothetical protein